MEALERIDAKVAEATGLDLDRAAADDLRTRGFDDAPAAVPADGFDADAVRAGLLDDAHVDLAVEALWPRLVPEDVVRALLTDPDASAQDLSHLTGEERALLLRAPGAPWSDADVALLDEAASLVDGPPPRTYGHVVVDEAQELTDMQWRMIVRRCPARSMTLVGDFAQAGPASTAHTWSETLGPVLGPRFDLHTLAVGYRTTREILETTGEFLARIAPGRAPSRSIRHGDAPRVPAARPDTVVATLAEELRTQAAEHPGELLGVICADARTDELRCAGVTRWAQLIPASRARGNWNSTAWSSSTRRRSSRPAAAGNATST